MARRKKKQKQAPGQPAARKIDLAKSAPGLQEGKGPASGGARGDDGAAPASPIASRDAGSASGNTFAGHTVPGKSGSGKKQAATCKGVAIPTCIAGMFLTLVLGLYLGTLMPGVIQDLQKPAVATRPAAAPTPVQDKMDPQLAGMVAELEKKAADNPDSAPDWINLGNIYFDAMQPAKAIAAYERALRLAPKNADVLTDLGIMYRETGQFEKAIEAFRRALELNPQHENAMFNQGVVLSVDLKRNAEAAAIWKRLLEMNPGARAPDGQPLATMIENLK